jgi:hypothetical protein
MNQRLPRAIADAYIAPKRTEVIRGSFLSSSHSAPAGLDTSRASRKLFLRPNDEVYISVPNAERRDGWLGHRHKLWGSDSTGSQCGSGKSFSPESAAPGARLRLWI